MPMIKDHPPPRLAVLNVIIGESGGRHSSAKKCTIILTRIASRDGQHVADCDRREELRFARVVLP